MTKEKLKKILVDARKKRNLTHEQVAIRTKTGITRQYYGMIENGDRRPSVEIAKAIAKVLKIDWIIFFEVQCNQTLRKLNTEIHKQPV